MRSISRFLLISLLSTVLGVTSVASLWSYWDSTHEVEELFDAELAQMARVLQSLLDVQLKRTQLSQLKDALQYRPFVAPPTASGETRYEDQEATRLGHKYESKLAFMVWNEQGDELLSSQGQSSDLSFQSEPGYHNEQLDQHHWRSFMLHDPQLRLWIKVAQRSDVREELATEIVEHTLLPLLLMIPLLGLLIAVVVRRGLNPLRRLSDQLATRNPNHMEPLKTDRVPAEISNVVDAINALLTRLDQALERERRFTADAAHELRTPLAAIRIHAQNLQQQLLRTATDNSSQTPGMIIEGVDQMTHVVEQLLTLSRLEFASDQLQQPIDLSKLLRQVTADLAPLALDRSQQLELDAPDRIIIDGDSASLSMLCRNLIDNAIRYTPPSGHISVAIKQRLGQVCFCVCDTGPGIAPHERDKVLQRFYRLADQTISGSGLGLSIAQQIVDQHGASLTLGDVEGGSSGLTVRVCFDQAQ